MQIAAFGNKIITYDKDIYICFQEEKQKLWLDRNGYFITTDELTKRLQGLDYKSGYLTGSVISNTPPYSHLYVASTPVITKIDNSFVIIGIKDGAYLAGNLHNGRIVNIHIPNNREVYSVSVFCKPLWTETTL